ncbi:TonB-dependent receptor [Parvularcula lutaonensis]|nr:TonB-dependent receptor [Parvularcula lutaonensis]
MLKTLALSTMLAGLALPAAAQDDDPALIEPAASEEARGDVITVTGSRLRRSSFDSISPLQVIDADTSRLSGLTTASEFITQSPVIAGTQLDNSINAGSPTAAVEGVGEGGVGSNNVALRGLGPERTLVLMNGRRLSPSGVRGAPVAPDLNLVPSLAVQSVEILTDGASSIYGADAVAGVVNVILRNDFDGIEFNAQVTAPEQSGGGLEQFGIIAGSVGDRGNVLFSAEYFNRDTVFVGDRRNYNDCLRDIEVSAEGDIFSTCLDARPDNAAFVSGLGFAFSTPGMSNIPGTPNWTTTSGLPGNFRTGSLYTLQDEERATQLLGGFERLNLYSAGEYELTDDGRHSVYFEGLYSNRESTDFFTSEQIFPGVPAMIPVWADGNGNGAFDGPSEYVTDSNGVVFADNPLNPFSVDALPVISTTSLPQIRSADVENVRLVGGFKGDIVMPWFEERNWVYDLGASYDNSYGTATQPILRENAIRESLDTLRIDAQGNLSCGTPRTALTFGFLTPENCVVVDFFADNLFTTTGGDKSFTDEERAFLEGRSISTTEIEQRQFYGLATGDAFELPAGTVGLAVGVEYRELEITSLSDVVRARGLAASEVPDTELDTIGQTDFFEIFAETEIPVLDTLDVNLSGRYTEEANFGDEVTYSVKAKWDPLDWLGLRATYGTTFRAPNLREQFLAGAAGTIGGGNDPCLVPADANNMQVYDPAGDDRSQALLNQCIADGADPFSLGLQATTAIPTSTGGGDDLRAETSDSYTAGFVFRQQWSDAFDFDLAVTYYNIEIEDTVRESDPANLLAQCYSDLPQQFACDRITRGPAGTVSLVDASFINVGLFETSGIDYVARFNMPLDQFSDMFAETEFGLTFSASQVLERTEDVDPTDPDILPLELEGTISNPEWSWLMNATLERGPFTALWRTRYIGEGQQLGTEDFDTSPDPLRTACGVLGYSGTGGCRDVDFVDDYFQNDVSLTYRAETWGITAGISNVFDEEPPLIDQGEGPSRMNIVTQSGYDLIGRRAFFNISKRF